LDESPTLVTPPSRVDQILSIGFARRVTITGSSAGNKSMRRSSRFEREQQLPPITPSLASVETDAEGRVVYVDLRSTVQTTSFQALLASLAAIQPADSLLARLSPINRGRLLIEIDDAAALEYFSDWLGAAGSNSTLGRLLQPLGSRLRLLGAQWIVPRATEYEPRIQPQEPHTDVDAKGEVVSVAINVRGDDMGTLIDANARVDANGRVIGGSGFGRAATPVFAYDTGAVHGGPGVAHVPGPYPRYLKDRVFFLLCSDQLEPARVAQHRRDNGLRGGAGLVVEI